MKNEKFIHKSLSLTKSKPLIYTAMSKHIFYYRMFISKFVIENGAVPLNPFMIFDYFMLDTVDRDIIREANNNLVMRSDELWVFGPISDGVLAEIKIAQKLQKNIKFFKVEKSSKIVECKAQDLSLEDDISSYKTELIKKQREL